MSETTSRFLRALRNIALAMLNATLILVALCLFLALRLSDRVDTIMSNATQNLISVAPLREDMQDMTGELAALRGDIATLLGSTGEMTSSAGQLVTERIGRFDARLNSVDAKVSALRERIASTEIDPGTLLDRAIATASAELAASFAALAGCELMQAGLQELSPPASGDTDTNQPQPR